jgi:hypothetical protein
MIKVKVFGESKQKRVIMEKFNEWFSPIKVEIPPEVKSYFFGRKA